MSKHRPFLRSVSLAVLATGAFTGDFCNSTAAEPPSDGSGSCKATIARFLDAPTADSYGAISRHGDECGSALKTKQLQALDTLVAEGNRYAAQLLAPHIRHLDGGELEDALRSVGQFAKQDMSSTIELCLSGALTERQFRNALTMLPSGLEDDFDAQLAELRARRAAVAQVTNPRAQELKRTGAASIDTFISDVERAKSATKAQKQ